MGYPYRRKPGRIRVRLAALLKRVLNVEADPADIYENNKNRYAGHLDLCRWWVHGTRDGRPITVSCWDTMGDVVRYGVGVVEDSHCYFEVACLKAPGDK